MTAVGIYGVVSLAASERTREIGIRMALGARALGVLWLVVRQGMTPALIGLVVGLGLAAYAPPAIQEQLYEIFAGDPFTYLLAALAVAGTAVAASLVPARRAAAIDPVTTLRHQ